jgi:hypothetical protein
MPPKSSQPEAQVRVGVGVFVFNDQGSFVLGKRMGSHGAGTLFKAMYIHFYYRTNFLYAVQAHGHCQAATSILGSHSRLVQCGKFLKRLASKSRVTMYAS